MDTMSTEQQPLHHSPLYHDGGKAVFAKNEGKERGKVDGAANRNPRVMIGGSWCMGLREFRYLSILRDGNSKSSAPCAYRCLGESSSMQKNIVGVANVLQAGAREL